MKWTIDASIRAAEEDQVNIFFIITVAMQLTIISSFPLQRIFQALTTLFCRIQASKFQRRLQLQTAAKQGTHFDTQFST
jgi:hypothetical protein